MQEIQWFRAYVEQILEDAWDMPRVVADDDGDYVYRYGTAACLVRVEPIAPMSVRVMARAATGVKRSAKLLAELNEHNATSRWVTTYWFAGAVYVDRAIDASGVTPETLTRVCAEIGQAADNIGTLIAGVFDGKTPFAPAAVERP